MEKNFQAVSFLQDTLLAKLNITTEPIQKKYQPAPLSASDKERVIAHEKTVAEAQRRTRLGKGTVFNKRTSLCTIHITSCFFMIFKKSKSVD